MRITIDVSVIISTLKENEIKHKESLDFLAYLYKIQEQKHIEIYQPVEWLLELAVVLRREKENTNINFVSFLKPEKPLRNYVVEITEEAVINFINKLNKKYNRFFVKSGADLLYLLTAHLSNSTLVTIDDGLKSYDGFINVKYPGEALEILRKI